jgi:hypothetical protein
VFRYDSLLQIGYTPILSFDECWETSMDAGRKHIQKINFFVYRIVHINVIQMFINPSKVYKRICKTKTSEFPIYSSRH